MRSGLFRGVVGVLFAMGVAAAGASCNGSPSGVGVSDSCSINSDCNSPLICAFGRCHNACTLQRDCNADERCVASTAGGVCQLTSESTCSATTLCQNDQVCGSDGQCRSQCSATGTTCASGDFCVVTPSQGACYSTTNTNDQTTLIAAHVIAADGAVLSDASTVVLDGALGEDSSGGEPDAGSAPDSTVASGDSGGSSSGGGGQDASDAGIEPCDATLLGNGTCDYCPARACINGTCVSGDHDYSCQCNAGFTGSGTKACTLLNGCVGSNTCPPSNPCVSIASAGAACLGEYPVWPIPDIAATGASTTVQPSYSNNGDGTITDNVTSIMWQSSVPANGCAALPPDAGPDATAPDECTLPEAQAYCASLRLAGYSDWRLPYLDELQSLHQCPAAELPAIANAFVPMPVNQFWTASPLESNPAYYWVVDYAGNEGCGDDGWAGTNSSSGVRCARGGAIPPTTPGVHYTVHPGALDGGAPDAQVTGDTVTDNWTGLVWQRGTAATLLSQGDAEAYCTALGSGFRLPTLKELLSTVDPFAYGPAIDRAAFPGTPGSNYYWTSTNDYSGGYGFIVGYAQGAPDYTGNVASTYYVRCVH
jgi:hypothetical protein